MPDKALCRLTHEPNVNFPLNILPLLCCTQRGKQRVECRLINWRVFKPGQEIERLILREITAVVKPSRQLGKMLKPDLRVMRLLFKNAQAFVLRERPPGLVFSNRDQCRAGCLGAPEIEQLGHDLAFFIAIDIPLIAGYSTKHPSRIRIGWNLCAGSDG